ncbi:MAG: AAA family ATPase [Rubrivivax sp.]|nr:AAA family ATPase [Rubrivivax sp.]
MSSLIEQAARRLEELRRAGVDIPSVSGAGSLRVPSRSATAGGLQGASSAFSEPEFVDTVPEAPAANDAGLRPVRPQHPPTAEIIAFAEPRSSSVRQPTRHLEIDLARLAGMGYLVPTQAQSLLSDLLRVIKRPLLQNMRRSPEAGGPARRPNVIVVTSAVPGEGKTFVATNLAMSIAMEVDHAALLIDGDVLRPSVFNRLALEPQTGLMDVLVPPRQRVDDLIVDTNIPKLTLLSAGTAQDRAEEMLASAAMDHLLDDLSERFHDRLIIIDSPPLLVTTESRALAERAGQVVLVVEADRTPRDEISRAFETLANCPIVLSVLNKSRAIESDYVYGY